MRPAEHGREEGKVGAQAGGTVHVAGQIVTRGDTNAYAEGITLSGDDGVLVEGMLDASSGAKDFSSDSGGDVVIASANGAVTLDSKIDLRGSSAGYVTIIAASTITMRGTIKLDERTCAGCTGVAGGIELGSTTGDIDFGGRVTSKGIYHYIDPFIVDAAGQAPVTASIRARERGDDTDGATIAVTGDRVSVEAPASFDVSGRFLGGTVRLR